MPSVLVSKLLSNPPIPINALAYGSGINQNSQVANQLNNLALGINYCLIPIEAARATLVSKQSSVKCAPHNFECSVDVHLARVVWTLLIQIFFWAVF